MVYATRDGLRAGLAEGATCALVVVDHRVERVGDLRVATGCGWLSQDRLELDVLVLDELLCPLVRGGSCRPRERHQEYQGETRKSHEHPILSYHWTGHREAQFMP